MHTYELLLEKIQDILFPLRNCLLCRSEGSFSAQQPWCSACEEQRLEEMKEENLCLICHRGIPSDQIQCFYCLNDPPPFVQALHLAPYGGKMKEAIQAFKYHNQKILAVKLGALAAEKICENPDFLQSDILIPVPLFSKKQIQRGFNQSALLAKQISRKIGIDVDFSSLVRIRNTPSQTQLNEKERRENVRGAFQVRSQALMGERILLIDDVFTTGATIRECTHVLLQAGVKSVYVLTLAAVPQREMNLNME